MKSIRDFNPSGKRVLVRVDFNVPLEGESVVDDTRIVAALPTIKYLIDAGAKVILMSHLGRPDGTGFQKEYSMMPVAKRLSELLGKDVVLSSEIIGAKVTSMTNSLNPGDVVLLENLRFDKREKKNDQEFCIELAKLGDCYVNDAFGTAHRAHASTEGIAHILDAYAGFLLEKEVKTLSFMLNSPQRPFVSVIGGSKVSDKIKIINALIDKSDCVIIGGAMCFTFLAALGYKVGISIQENDYYKQALEMIEKASDANVDFLLPVDVVCADSFSENACSATFDIDSIPDNMMGLDIGPKTCDLYCDAISKAKTVFWNGPVGVFEWKAFENGTKMLAQALANNQSAVSVIGGGDSVAAVNKFGLSDKMTFISTGGGASMQLVQGDILPGVAALN